MDFADTKWQALTAASVLGAGAIGWGLKSSIGEGLLTLIVFALGSAAQIGIAKLLAKKA